jgi:predicted O-methyltransferase YrrM
MISGPLQGSFIAQLVAMMKAKKVLEIGTFTGYTTIAIAEVLGEGAEITTIEINPEHHHIAESFIKEFQGKGKINLILGDAKQVLEEVDENWDMVLIDAAKMDNAYYYNFLLPKMKSGSVFLLDNVLWKGKILKEEMDRRTAEIDRFNKELAQDDRVEVSLLPIRDGITIVRKK